MRWRRPWCFCRWCFRALWPEPYRSQWAIVISLFSRWSRAWWCLYWLALWKSIPSLARARSRWSRGRLCCCPWYDMSGWAGVLVPCFGFYTFRMLMSRSKNVNKISLKSCCCFWINQNKKRHVLSFKIFFSWLAILFYSRLDAVRPAKRTQSHGDKALVACTTGFTHGVIKPWWHHDFTVVTVWILSCFCNLLMLWKLWKTLFLAYFGQSLCCFQIRDVCARVCHKFSSCLGRSKIVIVQNLHVSFCFLCDAKSLLETTLCMLYF